MNKIISIVIPAFNAELYIEQTIRSILNQTFQDFEIIIINDGSTDNTLKIIEKIALDDDRINFKSILNSGVSNARNEGIKSAKSKYILFLDADDILSSNFLQDRITFLEAHQEYSICGSSISTFTNEGEYIDTSMHAPSEIGLREILLYDPTVASIPSNLIIRADRLRKNDITFRSSLNSTADKFFLLELFKAGFKSKSINNSPLYYRIHSNSMSQKISKKLFEDNLNYFNLIISEDLVPSDILTQVKQKNYYILAGLSKKLKQYHKTFYFLMKYFSLYLVSIFKVRHKI
jgi:teichuronic acid biosynthesis glycosyltransferase TuaG